MVWMMGLYRRHLNMRPLIALLLCPCFVADIKTKKGITLNSKYEAGPKKYQLGATWNGTVSDRTTALKVRT